MRPSINVLHLFGHYLPTTQIWAFQLLDHLPDAELVVGSKNFLACDYYMDRIRYVRFFMTQFDNPRKRIRLKLINRVIAAVQSLYPVYLRKTVGHCDVMHSHFAPYGWEYRKMAQKMNTPHVVSFYGFDYASLPFTKPAWKKRYRELFKTADMFLCEGRNGALILEQSGCPPEKIQVARLGVDVNSIPWQQRAKSPGELNLIQIAAFTEKKGHQHTVRAFIEALQDCPDMTLTLVGEDRSGIKAELQRAVKQSGTGDKFIFKDSINYDDLHILLHDYHVFIHPSCYTDKMDCEGGAPVVLLDAQATGMPVIATQHCDIPDEVVHGQTGILCPEKDVAAIAAAIRQFYFMGQEAYNGFADNAREHAATNYDVSKNAAKIRTLYEKAISDYRGG